MVDRAPIKTFMDLEIYKSSHQLAMKLFFLSKKFPIEEKYSLTDQIRRSSRSVAANIAEGWGKRIFPLLFKKHLVDSLGSLEETKSWLMFSRDCEYVNLPDFDELFKEYDELGSKIWKLHEVWKDNN
ncbi:MAG: four helix bundle protein [Bacteroidales bacterium]|nr:four helix bundle protein [Bacteroidales bacterium]